jgi:hypothetical protein
MATDRPAVLAAAAPRAGAGPVGRVAGGIRVQPDHDAVVGERVQAAGDPGGLPLA